ncbi:hypothetical protein Pth03_31450 [Planotetraspora thailandica]|uniref:Glycoside hydrolase family 127 protein n=1 Tax=Planotetraspora thailandica TaxID=487172 RepID=A0A8J3XWH5_9ACTN|nr:beta-L-arabinofuranosidase domain-containing protein [Planotetraspora thailandica]GII54756.1 hypothetical protein Pth03_31450 [Planotetraspora thailandica]
MVSPVTPSSGVLAPLGLDSVRISPGFWADRDARVVIDHAWEWAERVGWIGNFRGEPRRGREFSDSEIYKLLEAMAWSGHHGFDELAQTVARAQEADGYLNTKWSGDRYADFEWGHELYCYGHLIQAGVARLRAHGEDTLTEVVRRAADHVCARFMDSGEVCGHPEIEMALVELYRATGTERYLEMARRFVERRGRPALADIELGREYFQDDVPVRQAESLRGHAVRAVYLACAQVDLAVETGDKELLRATEAQWEHALARRTYITGGIGSRHAGEAFGEDFELPPDRAYVETCAGVGSVMLAHRLLLATGDVCYADHAERVLYNVIAASPAADLRTFFYSNPLQVRTPGEVVDGVNPRAESALRAPWFSVSCCPNNLARTFASLAAYVATHDDGGVQVHHLTPAEIRHNGLTLRVETGYPWSGGVTVRVVESAGGPSRIALRVPRWADGARLDGRRVAPGYAQVEGEWQAGDEIRLDLPVEPRWTRPDPRIDAVRGCVAVERGPLVYCAEAVGDDPPLLEIEVDTSGNPVEIDSGRELEVAAHRHAAVDAAWPYGMGEQAREGEDAGSLRLMPYHRWGNRGPATMRVWLPEIPPPPLG